MNINTFFLNKLINNSKSPNLDSKKLANATYLFADIIKVCEDVNSNPVSNTNTPLTDLFAKEIKPLSENTIDCTAEDIKNLSAFLKEFLNNSTLPVKTSGTTQNLSTGSVSKKQFILSSEGLQEFLAGLMQCTGLNQNEKIKEIIANLTSKSKEDGKTSSSNFDAGNSLINNLQVNKYLNLSFKNGSEKISISLNELPEENIEAKISLEKLASDFAKLDKNANISPSKSNKETENINKLNDSSNTDKPVQQVIPGNTTIQAVQNNIDQASNAYKTEVLEIKAGGIIGDYNQVTENLNAIDKASFPANNTAVQNSGAEQSTNDNYFSGYKILPLPQSSNNNLDMLGLEFFNPGFRIKENTGIPRIKDDGQKIIDAANKKVINESLVQIVSNEEQGILSSKQVQTTPQNKTSVVSSEVTPVLENPKTAAENKDGMKIDINLLLKSLNGNIDSIDLSKSSVASETVNKVKPESNEFSEGFKNSGSVKISMTNELKVDDLKINTGDSIKIVEEEKPNQATLKGELKTVSDEKPAIQSTNTKINAMKVDSNTNTTDQSKAQFSEENSSKPSSDVNQTKPAITEKVVETVPDSSKLKIQAESQVQEIKNTAASESTAPKVFVKDDQSKALKDAEDKNTSQIEAAKKDQSTVKESQSKSTDDKDLAKQKPSENIKSVLHGTETAQNTEVEKFKISTESKSIQEPPRVIKPSELMPELSKFIQQGDKQSISFQLSPENLGKVKLMVEIVNSQVNTHIEVENSQVRQFVQSNIDQLKQSLNAAGIQLSNVNVSVADSDKRSPKGTGKKKQDEKNSRVESKNESTTKAQKSLGYNTYEFLA